MKKITAALAAFLLLLPTVLPVSAVEYFPNVTAEMERPTYWSERQEDASAILAAPEEIARLNQEILAAEGTNLVDLKSLPETFDGIAENEAALQEARDNKEWLLGWTYDSSGRELTETDFDALAAACVDPSAAKEMPVRYGIAVVRTGMLIYPTDEPILDDPADLDFDYRFNTGVRVNEPLLIYTTSADGNWYRVRGSCYGGWMKAADMAVCRDRAEWLSAWDFPAERTLVVYGDKLLTEDSNNASETANRLLTMGTTLELGRAETPASLVINRATWHNHVVYLPVRRDDGSYVKRQALIPARAKVSVGYLPLTKENIASVALEALGDAYGWGGMLLSEDCSGYVRSVYQCFGLELARNASWQALMPVAGRDLSDIANEEKRRLLDTLPLGATLFFKGHEMLYLGAENGRYYVINAASSMRNPWDETARQRSRLVAVNTLDARRPNGEKWLSELNYVNIPYLRADTPFAASWEWYHDGVAFCLKNGLMDRSDGEFRPYEAVTRRELAESLERIAGARETDDGSEPERAVTREELAVALWQAAKALQAEPAASSRKRTADCADAGTVDSWAREAVEWALNEGLLYGTSPDTIGPRENATRAQLAVVLTRWCERFGLPEKGVSD